MALYYAGAVKLHQKIITVRTPGQGLHAIDDRVQAVVAEAGVREGLCTVFIRHTSASLLIQENAAPSARRDLERFFARLCPEGGGYEHDDEGADDMPAHLRAALTQTTLQVPVGGGALLLGTWQGIYLFEHRRRGAAREVVVQVLGQPRS